MRDSTPWQYLARMTVARPAAVAVLVFLVIVGFVEITDALYDVLWDAVPAPSASPEVLARVRLARTLASGCIGALLVTVPLHLFGRRLRALDGAADVSTVPNARDARSARGREVAR